MDHFDSSLIVMDTVSQQWFVATDLLEPLYQATATIYL